MRPTMNTFENAAALGAPGIQPRWISSAKEGVGRAYHTGCQLWFNLSHGIGIACGGSHRSTAARGLQSLAEPFESHRERYVRQWQRAAINPPFDFSQDTGDGGGMYRLSRCILLAHEHKSFQEALAAPMSIPWGETKGDNDFGGNHVVWTRDPNQSATALLATGQPGRAAAPIP
jgi:glucoamylase